MSPNAGREATFERSLLTLVQRWGLDTGDPPDPAGGSPQLADGIPMGLPDLGMLEIGWVPSSVPCGFRMRACGSDRYILPCPEPVMVSIPTAGLLTGSHTLPNRNEMLAETV